MENCSIVSRPSLHLVGISYCGPYASFPDEAIRLQTEFMARKHELNEAAKSTVLYCPYHGNESFATFWSCFKVDYKMEEAPPGMVQISIPPHRYAMAACSNKRIGEGYEQLHAWMNEQGLVKQENAVSLELFYMDEQHFEEEPVELLIPIKD
ncbi:GyrI-like domain-containing protein [Paenibacillus sp. J5C_2022]|uniref:GyrI-like domain-containing protein n=1 Tax=Paenibacillus sp. J5C2022 TaxID=2977129 RepID=UPI0021D14182|nr:GyrI-like domain-containing protein [Paenibacillus sp. J5C2022]MCU6709536.1 GyrI-like domain-containing protein [Paenibacillus sp. J5C2022]